MTPAQLNQPRPALYFDDLQPVRGRRTDPQTSHDAASRAERYMGPAWTLRAGSDRAAAIPSRGTGC